MQHIGVIWAEAQNHVIGQAGTMPWHVPEDLAHFKATTLGAPVIMGRRTWESFPDRFRPLPGRDNIIVSRDASYEAEGGLVVTSLAAALTAAADRNPDDERVWVIGGGQIYTAALPLATLAVITELDLVVDGDTLAPVLDDSWRTSTLDPESGWHESVRGVRYRFRTLERSLAAPSQ